jgi:hypothetical protein
LLREDDGVRAVLRFLLLHEQSSGS